MIITTVNPKIKEVIFDYPCLMRSLVTDAIYLVTSDSKAIVLSKSKLSKNTGEIIPICIKNFELYSGSVTLEN